MALQEEASFPCKLCEKQYKRKDHLVRHQKYAHSEAEESSVDGPSPRCSICGQLVKRADVLLKHLSFCSKKSCLTKDVLLVIPGTSDPGSQRTIKFRTLAMDSIVLEDSSVKPVVTKHVGLTKAMRPTHTIEHLELLKVLRKGCESPRLDSQGQKDAIEKLSQHHYCLLQTHALCEKELGMSLLTLFCHGGTPWACQTVIRAGVDVNDVSQIYNHERRAWVPGSALDLAIIRNDVALVQTLLKANAQVNSRDDQGRSPLRRIIDRSSRLSYETVEITKTLVHHGANVNCHAEASDSLLHLAIRQQELSLVKILLEHGANMQTRNQSNRTPFEEAFSDRTIVDERAATVLRLLIRHAPDLNAVPEVDALLHFMIEARDQECIRILLEAGARTDISNSIGYTPLQALILGLRRVEQPEYDIISLLLSHGADPNVKCFGNDTLLHVAAESQMTTLLLMLLNHNAKTETRNYRQRTPLQESIWDAQFHGGSEEVVEILLEAHADVNVVDVEGDTLLHSFVRGVLPNQGLARTLLAYGADASLPNRTGETPFVLAQRLMNFEAARLLDKHATSKSVVMANSG